MYKGILQEFCQQRHWSMPLYTTTKHGLDHCPQFNALVVVNGLFFTIVYLYKSFKEAHNTFAMQAFQHFTQSPDQIRILQKMFDQVFTLGIRFGRLKLEPLFKVLHNDYSTSQRLFYKSSSSLVIPHGEENGGNLNNSEARKSSSVVHMKSSQTEIPDFVLEDRISKLERAFARLGRMRTY
ncbi:hypothetical protein ACFE04_021657 [Oxalis oulophora]